MHYQRALPPFLYLTLYTLLLNTAFFRTYIMPSIHLLASSTLLQAQLYQTFFVLKYEALPLKAVMKLQGRSFFIEYFWAQTLLVSLVALTVPPHGVYSLMERKMSMIFLSAAGGSALLNLVVYGPRTRELGEEVVDHLNGHRRMPDTMYPYTEIRPREMVEGLFSRAYKMSVCLNLVTVGATVGYGWLLAGRIKWDTT